MICRKGRWYRFVYSNKKMLGEVVEIQETNKGYVEIYKMKISKVYDYNIETEEEEEEILGYSRTRWIKPSVVLEEVGEEELILELL